MIGKLRRRHKIVSVLTRCRQHDQIHGQWILAGLIRVVGVNRRRVYELIERSVVPATQHPESGHYLIPDDPVVLATLQANIATDPPWVTHVDGQTRGGPADAQE